MTFIKHTNCPKCNSTNNLSVYSDGVWCESVGCGFKSKQRTVIDAALDGAAIEMTQTKVYDLPEITAINKVFRGITPDTFARYGVGKNGSSIIFPYYKDGFVVGHKARDFSKQKDEAGHFTSHGEAGKAGLFGVQSAHGERLVIVTEGEFDALAAYQMTGYPAVSVFNASSAAGKVKQNLQWLEAFDTVYLCFDMDAPGREAQAEVMKVLKPGKARPMTLPLGFKDANAMLEAGKGVEFKHCVFQAKATLPKGVLSKDEQIERTMEFLLDKGKRHGKTTGYAGLDTLIGGYREGELHTVVGGTGIGKSTVTRNLCYQQIKRGVKSLYIPLEDTLESSVARFGEMLLEEHLIKSESVNEQQVRQVLFNVLENLWVYDNTEMQSLDDIIASIEYIIREHDIQFVVLDHITAMSNSVEGSDERKSLDKCIEKLKRSIALALRVTVVVVSHMSRDSSDKEDNMPTLSRIKGASSIAQYSDTVFGVSRERGADEMTVATLKQNRLWGKHGDFKLLRDSSRLQLVEANHFDEETTNEKGAFSREGVEGGDGDLGQAGHLAEPDGVETTQSDSVHPEERREESDSPTGVDNQRVGGSPTVRQCEPVAESDPTPIAERPNGDSEKGGDAALHAGLPNHEPDGEVDIRGVQERNPGESGQVEVSRSKRLKPQLRFKARIPQGF